MKCKIDGCDREAVYRADCVCQMHYFRFMRNGTYELLIKRKYRNQNKKGYQMIHEPDHPLVMKNGYVYEHRFMVYEKYGNDLPNCEFCGKALTWKNVHIDHINGDVKDNVIDNLRPLCRSCNTMRSSTKRIKHSCKNTSSITYMGVTMTAAEWARQKGVNVCPMAILARINKGWSVASALFTPSRKKRGFNSHSAKYKNIYELNSSGITLD
ncbi:HNH endonuclease signature motif containing protein [Gallibacterium anatis]|uniref:HNH endonuclease signature motif containing protein n=3 Tax=Pasteurellaceae TaxID=712 RepID=UPI0039FDD433